MKELILNFLIRHACGVRNAKKRHEILALLKERHSLTLSDRTFRKIVSTLRKERKVGSHSAKGIWFIAVDPRGANDSFEIDWAIRSFEEDKSKAFDMLEGASKAIDFFRGLRIEQDLFAGVS